MPARIAALAVLLLVLATPARGRAQEDPAVALARAAEVMLDEGRLDEALALFLKAHEMDPAPTLLYNIARVYDRKGDWVEARTHYERFLAAEKDPDRRARGQARLEEMLDRVPGRILVEAEPGDAVVTVDETEVPRRDGAAAAEVRRGPHRVKVALDGFVPVEQVADVPPGGEVRLRVALLREIPDDPAPIRAGTAGQRRGARFGPWKWVAIGVGAGLAATGGVLHGLAASGWADVDDAARHADGTVRYSSMTRSGAMDRQRSADRKMDAAIGLYAAGGAALVTGIVFWILDAKGAGGSGGAAGAPALGPGPGEAGIAASWRF